MLLPVFVVVVVGKSHSQQQRIPGGRARKSRHQKASRERVSSFPFALQSLLLRFPFGPLKPAGGLSESCVSSTNPATELTHRYRIIVGRQFISNCKAIRDCRIQGVLKVKRTVVLSYKGVYNLFLIQLSVP